MAPVGEVGMRRLCLGAMVLPLLTACSDVPVAGEDPTVTLPDPAVFEAGELVLVAPWVGNSTPRFTFDDSIAVDSLHWTRLPPDTFLVSVARDVWPDYSLRQGQHQVTLEAGGVRSQPIPFVVYGGMTTVTGAAVLGGAQLVGGPAPQVWVGLANGLGRMDLRWPGLVELVDSTVRWDCLVQAGPSVVPGAVVVVAKDPAGNCGALHARGYTPSGRTEIDSGPTVSRLVFAAHLGTGSWLIETLDSILVRFRGPAGTWTGPGYPGGFMASDQAPVLSPDGRRAVVFRISPETAYLLDAATGAILAREQSGGGALFLGTGDTLVLTGRDSLVFLDADDGHRLGAVGFPFYLLGQYLIADAGHPYLYVVDLQGGAFVVVLDRRTWRMVGRFNGMCVCVSLGAAVITAERRLLMWMTQYSDMQGYRPTQPYPGWLTSITLVP